MKSAQLSRKFHSRPAAVIMVAIAALYLALSSYLGVSSPPHDNQGIGLLSPSVWPLSSMASALLNIGFTVVIMLMMSVLNRAYNILRAISWLPIGLFAMMQAAVPTQVLWLNSGTLVCLVIVIGLYMMFSVYDSPGNVRTIFLTFMLLSLGVAVEYCFAFFIPVFWVISLQMRAFTPRCIVGSLLGILTVWIILLGFGIVDISSLRLPEFTSIFGEIDLYKALYLLSVVGITAFMLLSSILANFLKTIAYNAQARGYNGALTVISVVCMVAMTFDYGNMLAYLPLLNFSAAYQITHYFLNHRYDRQYIAVLAICGIYMSMYMWRLTL